MALPTLVIMKPYILITVTQSPNGLEPISATKFSFGYVEQVYETCDGVTAGEYVYFDNTEQSGFSYNNTAYYLIQENKILFKEDYAPAP